MARITFVAWAGLGLAITLAPRAAWAELDHAHRLWGQVLKAHVKVTGAASFVDYEAIKKDPGTLHRYATILSAVTREEYESFSKAEKLAFLINAYNAFTVKLVAENYHDKLRSIRDIWIGNEWKRPFFTLLGEKLSLDNVEHDLIRENGNLTTFREPRIHFALNCASKGCPALMNRPYVASKLDRQLGLAAKTFLRDRSRNYFDESTATLHLSPILASWYKSDFKKFHTSVGNFVATLVTDDTTLQAKIRGQRVKIKKTQYDWSLNNWQRREAQP